MIEYAHQAAEALSYVHGQNVVHRDVKPHNLVLGADGLVLVDFGVAREEELDQGGTRALGTPLYMAPEVLVGEEVSARSDVYGLAATIWALLAGKPPAYEDPTPLAEQVPGAPEEVLRAALAIRPERRLASVSALADGLGVTLPGAEGRSLALSISAARGAQRAAGGDRAHRGRHLRSGRGLDRPDRRAPPASWSTSRPGARERTRSWACACLRGGAWPARWWTAARASPSPTAAVTRGSRANVARKVGYVPHTMLLVPLRKAGQTIGVLSILDRRDGGGYRPADVERGTAVRRPGGDRARRVAPRGRV